MAASTKSRTNHQTPSAEELEQIATQASQPTPIGDVNQPLVTQALHPPPSGPVSPRVITVVTLRYPGYEKHTFRMWKNHKIREQQPIHTGTWDQRVAAFHRIVLEHNGWCDDEGNPLPPASDTEQFLQEISPELYAILVEAIVEEARRVPDFPSPTPRR